MERRLDADPPYSFITITYGAMLALIVNISFETTL